MLALVLSTDPVLLTKHEKELIALHEGMVKAMGAESSGAQELQALISRRRAARDAAKPLALVLRQAPEQNLAMPPLRPGAHLQREASAGGKS